jgi:ABC-2 type transport system ATP-binding protein
MFEVDQAQTAKEHMDKMMQQLNIAVQGNRIVLTLEKEQIADVNKLLVQAGIKVYSIVATSKTLEDKFLEMTGSDPIA